jgi:hypothetical protein
MSLRSLSRLAGGFLFRGPAGATLGPPDPPKSAEVVPAERLSRSACFQAPRSWTRFRSATLNPKVEGSNPSRPIERRGPTPYRSTIQSSRTLLLLLDGQRSSRLGEKRHGLPTRGLADRAAEAFAYGRLGQGLRPGLYADRGIWNRSGPFRTKLVVQTTCPVAIARTGLKGTSMNVSPAATVFGVQLFS